MAKIDLNRYKDQFLDDSDIDRYQKTIVPKPKTPNKSKQKKPKDAS